MRPVRLAGWTRAQLLEVGTDHFLQAAGELVQLLQQVEAVLVAGIRFRQPEAAVPFLVDDHQVADRTAPSDLAGAALGLAMESLAGHSLPARELLQRQPAFPDLESQS